MYIYYKNVNLDDLFADWIPVSYKNYLTNNMLSHSKTFILKINEKIAGICRAYFISKNRIELGDVWITDEYRGKKINVNNKKNPKKISLYFLQNVIKKIWKIYPNATKITLEVNKNNIPAKKLYEKLFFTQFTKPKFPKYKNNSYSEFMIRRKLKK